MGFFFFGFFNGEDTRSLSDRDLNKHEAGSVFRTIWRPQIFNALPFSESTVSGWMARVSLPRIIYVVVFAFVKSFGQFRIFPFR